MHFSLVSLLFPLAASAANLVLSNDDGWAEINVRTFFNVLTAAGESVVLSAPAENQSGTGSLEKTPSTVTDGCEFSSCPANSPPIGSNSSQPRFTYVNSFPVTAMKFGVQNLSSTFFERVPDLVVTGPNVGANTGFTTVLSGTVGAASAASDQLGIPGIAFSGTTGTQTSFAAATPDYSLLYADIATNVTKTLLASGAPFLPSGTWLNVNFPEAGAGTSCTSPNDFKFVLSRIYTSTVISGPDVTTCNNGGVLPPESTVVGTTGCFASISVGLASNKLDANKAQQTVVLGKLSSILSCLPS